MPVSKGVWGIDIGQCALKALRLEMIDGVPTATAFDYVEHPKILSQSDAEPDVLIREALEKFLSRNQIKHDQVAIGIAGQSGLARFVKLPPVQENKIAEIVKFEAKQQIPFPLDEVVWDFQKISGGTVTDGFAMETEIGLFAMKRDIIGRYMGYFNASRVEVHLVQMSPLALVNYTTFETLKKGGSIPVEPDPIPEEDEIPRGKVRCVVVLDIGTDGSNLIITDGEKIIWHRALPLGGNNFTRALVKDLKLTFAKAEHLKRNAAKSPELPQILKALKPVLTDFVGEVQRSLGYFTNTHRNAHVAYLVGLGSAFRLPGLQKYLSEKLQIEVKKPAKFSRVAGDAVLNDPLFQENVLTFPVAYGLALQGLGEARLTTNLLPNEIRVDRMIRAKKPFAVTAAAVLLLGTGALALGYGSSLAAVTNKDVAAAVTKSESAVREFTDQEKKYTQKDAELKKVQKDVKAIIAGQDERLNWCRFEQVLTALLPKPGENGNLKADQSQTDLWRSESGLAAEKWFADRMRVGVPIEKALADETSKYPESLAMVNIEAVYPRYVDNLKTFFERADEVVSAPPDKGGFSENIADSMKPDEREADGTRGRDKPKPPQPPEGAPKDAPVSGWVVEIRGYTFHNRGSVFVRDALVKNLQRADTFIPEKAKDQSGQDYFVGGKDPVKGKISHAFVYHVWTVDQTPGSNWPVNITRTYLDDLVKSASSSGSATAVSPAAPAGPPPAPGTPPAPAAPVALGAQPASNSLNWEPLTGTPAVEPRPATAPAPMPGTTAPVPKKDELVRPKRHEFVVMFVWREPVPAPPDPPAPPTPPPGAAPKPAGPATPPAQAVPPAQPAKTG